jgi:hypothetical protein
MSLPFFGAPDPPKISDPVMFTGILLLGLTFLLSVAFLVDRLGTAMYRRGFAKPFYIKGRRIHHSIIYPILTISYGALSLLYLLGYLHVIGNDFWLKILFSAFICAGCMGVDIIGDKYWPEIRKNVIFHHEWIYAVIPVFIFTYVVYV